MQKNPNNLKFQDRFSFLGRSLIGLMSQETSPDLPQVPGSLIWDPLKTHLSTEDL